MKPRINFRIFCLTAVLLGTACAPAAAPASAPAVLSPTLEQAAQPARPAASASVATEAATQVPLPVATSRGPNLEATDPAGVLLASGSLQLVEFFRFT